jgi:hypothetical protein
MSIYVDNAMNQFGRMKMSHMISDTTDELHSMADKIGIQRKWFQNNPDHPHYDISQSKRKLAIQYGAIEITAKELVEIIQGKRNVINIDVGVNFSIYHKTLIVTFAGKEYDISSRVPTDVWNIGGENLYKHPKYDWEIRTELSKITRNFLLELDKNFPIEKVVF